MENEVIEKAYSTATVVSGGIGGVATPAADILGTGAAVVDRSGVSTTSDGGILLPEQSRQFIEYIFEQQVLARDGRRVTMRANTAELEKLHVGERVIRAAAQANDTFNNANVAFTKVEVTTKKIRLDWEVATEALEDNIEGAGLEDHLVRTMTRAFANDIEDLAINGDTASTGSASAFLNILDGFYKKETAGGTDAGAYASGSAWTVQDLQDIVLAMPRKYRASRASMKFYAGSEALAKHHNQTIRNPIHTPINSPIATNHTNENVSLSLPIEFIDPPPPNSIPIQIAPPKPKLITPQYGCMKNGSLPTYRNWKNQTQKNYNHHTPSIPIPINSVSTSANLQYPSQEINKDKLFKEKVEALKKRAAINPLASSPIYNGNSNQNILKTKIAQINYGKKLEQNKKENKRYIPKRQKTLGRIS